MRRKLIGRHPLTIGAIILLGLSVYELWVRFEDFQAWTLGVHHLSKVRGTSFFEDMIIIFEVPEMRQMAFKMLYLIAMIIIAIICLVKRNRAKSMWIIFILSLLSAAAGIWLEIYALTSWVQIIKLIPLGLIAAGSIINQANYKKSRYIKEDLPPRSR